MKVNITHAIPSVESIDIHDDQSGATIEIKLQNGKTIRIAPENDGFGILNSDGVPQVWVMGDLGAGMHDPDGGEYIVGKHRDVSTVAIEIM